MMRLWKLAVGLFALLAGSIAALTSAVGFIHSPAQQLAVVVSRHQQAEIFLVDVTRGLLANLTRSAGDDSLPAWSPDGQHLIFYSQRNQRTDLYMTDANGRGIRRLVASGGAEAAPAWSPDGQWIAYAAIHQPNTGLFIMRPDGSGSQRLTNFRVETLVWSPDSGSIALVANCDSNCDIYVVRVSTGQVRQLTHNGLFDAYPTWSPDSQRIAFMSNRLLSFEVYVMALSCDEKAEGGCAAERLTHNHDTDTSPAWSPDGKQIAFSSDRTHNFELFTVQAGCYRLPQGCDSQTEQITYDVEKGITPIWSPDGSQIAYWVSSPTSKSSIYVMDMATQATRLLIREVDFDSTIAWRPVR